MRYSVDPGGADQAAGVTALSDNSIPEWREDLQPPNQGKNLISRCLAWIYDPSPEGKAGSEFVELRFRGLSAGRSRFSFEVISVELRYFLSVHPSTTASLKVFNANDVCVHTAEVSFKEDTGGSKAFETSGGRSSIRKLIAVTDAIDIAKGWTVVLRLQMGVRDDNPSLKRMMALGEVTVRTIE